MSRVNNIKCVVFGAGGHARVLIDCLLSAGTCETLWVLDSDSNHWKKEILGVPILGNEDCLADLVRQGANHFTVGVGSVGNPEPRRRLFELGLSHRLNPVTAIHPSAVCSKWAEIGPGCQLFANSVVNPCAKLGRCVIVNTGAIVEHDGELGDFVHIATGAKLAGTVKVGAGAHIGAGATVKEKVVIGEGALVGAGAVVVREVEPRTVVAGVPARILRKK